MPTHLSLPVFEREIALATRSEPVGLTASSAALLDENLADPSASWSPIVDPSTGGIAETFGTRFPALRALGLRDEDLLLLASQGYLEFNRRSAAVNAGYWRLRYRREGQLRAQYIGNDIQRLARIRRELAAVQLDRRQRRRQAQTLRQARQLLKRAKATASPIALHLGWHFHGKTLRRFRKARHPQRTLANGGSNDPRRNED
jgi:hypothetical protein